MEMTDDGHAHYYRQHLMEMAAMETTAEAGSHC
jgi:hypothetical protein